MSRPTFNLVDEPWVPVVDLDGHQRELGLRDLFVDAHRLRGVVDPSPLAEFSILRLLWVLTHRLIQGPKSNAEWKAQWLRGRFDEAAVDAYFDKWRHRFDLFDERWPFYQVGGLETVTKAGDPERATISKLVPESASKSNPTLFDHSIDDSPPRVSSSGAARMLLIAQAFSFGGGKALQSVCPAWGTTTHPNFEYAPCTGAISAYVDQPILYRTLSANLPLIGPEKQTRFLSGPNDLPAWERSSQPTPGSRVPNGYLDRCSWLPRFIRLFPDEHGYTSQVAFTHGTRFAEDAESRNPFSVQTRDKKTGRPVPVNLDPARAVWRDSTALFANTTETADIIPFCVRELRDGRLSEVVGNEGVLPVVCIGLANDQANALAWRRETITAPLRLLSGEATTMLEAALGDIEAVWQALRSALYSLARGLLETEDRSADDTTVKQVRNRFLAKVEFWERMEPRFRLFIGDLDEHARAAWIGEAKRIAHAGLVRASNYVEGNAARVGQALVKAERSLAVALAKVGPSSPTSNNPSNSPEAS